MIHRWNYDKPHRCPQCHTVADVNSVARWRAVTCCQCGTQFARWPVVAWFLPRARVVCDEHRDGAEVTQ